MLKLTKEGSGFSYEISSGELVARGWARGSRHDAKAESLAHLLDLKEAETARDTLPSPPPPPPCPDCDGSGSGWDGDPSHDAWKCERCAGTGAAACDCGELATVGTEYGPRCTACLALCHHCGARPHTVMVPGSDETQFCAECLSELSLGNEFSTSGKPLQKTPRIRLNLLTGTRINVAKRAPSVLVAATETRQSLNRLALAYAAASVGVLS